MTNALWRPDPDRANALALSSFIGFVRQRHGKPPTFSYDDLFRHSVAAPQTFWSDLWDFAGVIGDKGQPPYLVDADRMPGARYFPEARLNYAENILAPEPSGDALVFWSEGGVKSRQSWADLRREVAGFQGWLKAAGVGVADRVVGLLPNHPAAVAAMLAASSIGAVWSSCSPDFGIDGVVDRFSQIEPRVLVACDGYRYGGKIIDIRGKLTRILERLPTVTHVVIVPIVLVDNSPSVEMPTDRSATTVTSWTELQAANTRDRPTFERFPFPHPLYVLFSSGTTGTPKCIVHSAGGVLLKHISEQRLHLDIKPGDRVFYFTTLGWMMWNWLLSCLGAGASLLLYDGSPLFPDETVLWDYAAEEACTHFGTSAKYIDTLRKNEIDLKRSHELSALRAILSTGSPLSPECFEYVYSMVKPDVHLASISGGTDLCGCFVIGNPLKPVWSGEIQGAALGMDIDVVDTEGQPLPRGKGELVCRLPFPSMPTGFWNDVTGSKYHSAYFARYPGIWHHGDFAEWTEHGGIIIHGRSDATLNPGGVRIGTAEIYRQVEQIDGVQESVVVGQDWAGDVRVVLFVMLKPGVALDNALERDIKLRIRTGCSPRHVPAKIIAVPDIPRTRSGKLAELAVRNIITGRAVENKEALANPESLQFYADLSELSRP
ncbi:acetoacetate--CoA ligase [Hyphomicrobium sp.]|uniref:acetoacetate--CoA ligase n=1 Tax=Hyphomicrobium sp. TaxID=82 RepID=UPI0025B92049|nr:acetoacetate--CoA ligase [Hyphomicrobium sp.]MCC7252140.1 acetoacetate--CoA ligase [Hyphomicrobium sp.]